MLYKQVHETLRDEIRVGAHPVGERLPSEAELMERFEVSSITLRRALDLLRGEGYVSRRPRVGTIVISTDPSPAPVAAETGHLTIGCVVTNFDDTFGSRVLEGLLEQDDPRIHLALSRSHGDQERENAQVRTLIESGVAGLIVLPSSSEYIPPSVLELVTQRFPVVILDRSYDGVPLSTVSSDNFAGAKAATEHLIDLGHRRVGFVTSTSHVSTADDRRNGWVHAHAARDIPLPDGRELRTLGSVVPDSHDPIEDDVAALEAFVAADAETTAYLVTEYNLALLLREACRRQGMSVPGDVSVVCFDHPAAAFDRELFRFTHVEQDQYGLGSRALEQVRAQIADRGSIGRVVLPTRLVEGASTAPAGGR
ncbi:GntR family transcriptional regulator [Schumannella luteola]|uniref:DNA-binding LacI/PurR family transcriptional regulator n=1 Tax=Schumannella luteola TaxID=472059 RepID=A0A852Y8L1_9MICO|nr:GntR family transcriptional regulator [Schumannella luteola]NYG98192.1 DNA-binding LacI/PurR family transcriptional regulator [Schumannella luteola]TPW93294.1 GntR family transcriptional regulator [Schumannella luteola]